MISSLNELEWGWICSAAIFAWIRTKSEQAVAEGTGYDQAIRAMPGSYPQPWEAGVVTSILPALGEMPIYNSINYCMGIDEGGGGSICWLTNSTAASNAVKAFQCPSDPLARAPRVARWSRSRSRWRSKSALP